MNQLTSTSPDDQDEDILFECPQCGKSLEIDARGAGYIIVCPDCKNEIQVPTWNADDAAAGGGDSANRERIKIEETLAELQSRVMQLEKLQKSDDQCFKRIADEINLIQSALDRITEVVESRQSNS